MKPPAEPARAPAAALAAPPAAEESPPPTPHRRRSRSRCCWAVCILVPILAAAAAVRIEDAARLLLVHVVQHSVGRGALKNAPVTLESMDIELRHWRIELRGLRIGNVPGEWDAPHAVTLERLRLSVGGLLGLLSLLQVPQANKAGAPGGLLRLGALEFTVGFCIKAIEELELSGISVHLETRAAAAEPPVLMRGPLRKRRTNVRLGAPRLRLFELEPSALRWFEAPRHATAEEVGEGRRKQKQKGVKVQKGSLRLYSSSSVEVAPRSRHHLELISSKERLTLLAESAETRDAWVAAIQAAIDALVRVQEARGAVGPTNAPWLDALDAEGEARIVRWRQGAEQRRREWRRRWRLGARHGAGGKGGKGDTGDTGGEGCGAACEGEACDEADCAAGGGGEEEEEEQQEQQEGEEGEEEEEDDDDDEVAEVVEDEDDDDEGMAAEGEGVSYFTLPEEGEVGAEEEVGESGESGGSSSGFTSLLRRLPGADLLREGLLGTFSLLENVRERNQKRKSNQRESSFAEALEWQIGRLTVRNLTLTINGHYLALKSPWELRGFLGSEKKLKRRLVHGGGPHQLGLFAKLVKDSSGRHFVNGVNHFTGKEQYHFGDVSKAAIGKIGSGVLKGGQKLGPPLLRGVKKGGRTIGSGVKKGGKKIGQKIAPGVNHFTGKDEYHFGDVSKAAIGKIGSGVIKGGGLGLGLGLGLGQKIGSGVKQGVSKGVSGITGQKTYRFGDLTRSAVRQLRKGSKKRARRRVNQKPRLPGPPAEAPTEYTEAMLEAPKRLPAHTGDDMGPDDRPEVTARGTPQRHTKAIKARASGGHARGRGGPSGPASPGQGGRTGRPALGEDG